jgi:hypothetical protein
LCFVGAPCVTYLPSKKILATVLVGGWLAATGWGMWKLASYSLAPGAPGAAPQSWPADATVARDTHGFTVVLALHPECPCSRATLEELDGIMAQSAGRLHARALFVQLPELPPVEKSELWQRARRITGVQVEKDPAGAEARRFGARTSGETRLFGPDGRLLFHGGITIARGHAGENPGETAIVDLIGQRRQVDRPIATPVFGCALWEECAAPTP